MGEGITGERWGRGKSRNVNRGPMGMHNGVGIDCGNQGGGSRAGVSSRVKSGTTVTKRQ